MTMAVVLNTKSHIASSSGRSHTDTMVKRITPSVIHSLPGKKICVANKLATIPPSTEGKLLYSVILVLTYLLFILDLKIFWFVFCSFEIVSNSF